MESKIIVGDNLDVLPMLAADSFDSCVTDPPYGIGFMGREWDTFKPGTAEQRVVENKSSSENPNLKGRSRSPASSPSAVEYDRSLGGQRAFQAWNEAWAREVLRVLKPGAYMLVCGMPRGFHRMIAGVEDAGFEIRDCIMWVFGQGFPKSHNLKDEWAGWGTALKPAWEPILVARKPLKGTVARNMRSHGTGAININAARTEGGRWPANVIHDGSDEVLAAFPDAPGQLADASTSSESRKFQNVYGDMRRGRGAVGFKMWSVARRFDSGSAARFFYCAKANRADRGEGNNHPTVKPAALMQYLLRLVTQLGGLVLDPFAGSGSTGKAAAREGFSFIGIERYPDYVAIAEARIAADRAKQLAAVL